MKKGFLLALFLLFTKLLIAQSLDQWVIGSSGGYFAGASTQLSWTAGETVTSTLTAGNNTLTQGFHQTFINVNAIQRTERVALNINVFPNPSTHSIFINVDATLTNFQIELFDVLGRSLQQHSYQAQQSVELNLSEYAAGNYLLRIKNGEGENIQLFKIQKIQ